MAKKRIKPVDLSSTIDEILQEYGDEVYAVLDDCVQDVADEAVRKLHESKYPSDWGHPWDAYANDWTFEKQQKGRLETVRVVFNSDHYRLAHLLEFGHVKQNGGRTRAFPHIAPVNDWVDDELPKLVGRKLG